MKANRLVIVAAILIVAVVAVLVARGRGAPPRARPVRIERVGSVGSDEGVGKLFPSWLAWFTTREDGEPEGTLLREGDLFFLDDPDDALFQYTAGDGAVLKPTADEWSARLSGRIVTVSLDSDSAWRWMESASERELAGVRFVTASESLDRALPAGLERLAAANPNVGLWFTSEAAVHQVLPLFQPHMLNLDPLDDHGTFDVDLSGHLASLRTLETLWMSASDSGSFDVLPALPRLRRLAVVASGDGDARPLPAGLRSLRSLSVIGVDPTKEPSYLRAAPAGLEELSLLMIDSSPGVDLTRLPDLPALRTLILDLSEVSGGLSSLSRFKRLEWLGLPKNITQQQFAELIAAHPDLRTLEIVEADTVLDLAPLRELKRLEGLVLCSDVEHLDVLNGLTSLRFVALKGDSASRAAIRRALPEALVVPAKPLCLGSGWILLLLPVSAGFWLLGWYSRTRRAAGARAA